jgi:uncharacterized membrane protein YcaP (DUF421 family)
MTVAQMSARALIVFLATLLMLRLAHKRFFAQRNTLDILLTLILASTLSRAINGSAPFFPTLVVGFGLILLHRMLTYLAARFPLVGRLVKGSAVPLIDKGKINAHVLRRHSLSTDDLQEDLRLSGVDRPEAVRSATLERNGEVSVIRAKEPQ